MDCGWPVALSVSLYWFGFINGRGLCLTTAWSCVLLACHCGALPRLCPPLLTWLHPASLSLPGSLFPYMWSLHCHGSFLPFTIPLLLSLPLSQVSQWFSNHCCPRGSTNGNSGLFCHSSSRGSQRMPAQGTSFQAGLPPGSDTCRVYLLIIKHIS